MNVGVNNNARGFDRSLSGDVIGKKSGFGYDQKILRSLRKIIRAVDVYSRKINNSFGITTPQMICLNVIKELGPISLSRLSTEVNLCGSTVNGIVDRLVGKKLISRVRSRKDRRQVQIKILPAGLELIENAPPLLQDCLGQRLSGLSETERRQIASSLEHIAEMMEFEDLSHHNKVQQ